jgi:hypothetical protein
MHLGSPPAGRRARAGRQPPPCRPFFSRNEKPRQKLTPCGRWSQACRRRRSSEAAGVRRPRSSSPAAAETPHPPPPSSPVTDGARTCPHATPTASSATRPCCREGTLSHFRPPSHTHIHPRIWPTAELTRRPHPCARSHLRAPAPRPESNDPAAHPSWRARAPPPRSSRAAPPLCQSRRAAARRTRGTPLGPRPHAPAGRRAPAARGTCSVT